MSKNLGAIQWFKRQYPDDVSSQISHETIYRSLFVQTRGVLKKELLAYLRSPRSIRRSRHTTLKGKKLGQIKNMVSIRERPASVEDRAVPGHWEGNLIAGPNNSYIVTLVEHSRKLPEELYKSLAWDRGKELSDHRRFTMSTDVDVYFCDPRSPWQRGSNENTNRLLRQYFPKGTVLSRHSQIKLNAVARQLSERPRKPLDYETPAERFDACVAATN